jgi:hypothetical protein
MYEVHRTTEVVVKPVPKPISPLAERIVAASIAGYIRQLAKAS